MEVRLYETREELHELIWEEVSENPEEYNIQGKNNEIPLSELEIVKTEGSELNPLVNVWFAWHDSVQHRCVNIGD